MRIFTVRREETAGSPVRQVLQQVAEIDSRHVWDRVQAYVRLFYMVRRSVIIIFIFIHVY